MANSNIPKIKSTQVIHNGTDLASYMNDNMYSKDDTMNKTQIEDLVRNTINPVPNVNYYNSESEIPITNGEQIIFYAACSGLIRIKLTDTCIYEQRIENMSDSFWLLWIQNTDIQGSFINTLGTRKYMQTGCIIEKATTEFIPDDTSVNNSYVFVTIV